MMLSATLLRYKFWLSDFVHGSPIRSRYRKVREADIASDAHRRQHTRLVEMLRFARANCPFYAAIDSDCLTDYPVVNKQIVIDNARDLTVDASRIPGQKGPVFVQRTSGSTGSPLAIPQDSGKRLQRIADLKYFNRLVGHLSHQPLVHMRVWNRWHNKSALSIRRDNIYPYDISNMDESRMAELCGLIQRSQAVALRGYASTFDILAKYVAAHPSIVFPKLKICIAGSEALGDDTRANVKRFLGCDIISQYANEECGILAQERIPTADSDNMMYLNNGDYVFEFLRLDCDREADYNEPARIVVTDLDNHAHPLIRYDTGDIGVKLPPDGHSNGFPVLGHIYGRSMDVCHSADGSPISPMLPARVIKNFDRVRQWQFIQQDRAGYTLRIVLDDVDDPQAYLEPALRELLIHLGENACLDLEITNHIPTLPSGKRKTVVNLMH